MRDTKMGTINFNALRNMTDSWRKCAHWAGGEVPRKHRERRNARDKKTETLAKPASRFGLMWARYCLSTGCISLGTDLMSF